MNKHFSRLPMPSMTISAKKQEATRTFEKLFDARHRKTLPGHETVLLGVSECEMDVDHGQRPNKKKSRLPLAKV